MSVPWPVLLVFLILAAALPAQETAVRRLPLAGPAAARAAEFSGLAWHGETLILLPQFPKGALMALDKPVLRAAVAAATPEALTPRALAFDDGGLPGMIPGFAGYEALAVAEGRVYLAVETEGFDCTMGAWIVTGRIDEAGAIILAPDSRVAVPLGAQRCNMGVEALTLHGGSIYVFEEANGQRVQRVPRVHVYGLDLRPLPSVAGPVLEYRLTDATAVGPEGVFWVSNYLWPGDTAKLDPVPGPEDIKPEAGSHSRLPQVERLVEMRVEADRVVRTARTPVWLALDPPAGRNWEGIARLDTLGFLLVSDAHPETIFGFVPVSLE